MIGHDPNAQIQLIRATDCAATTLLDCPLSWKYLFTSPWRIALAPARLLRSAAATAALTKAPSSAGGRVTCPLPRSHAVLAAGPVTSRRYPAPAVVAAHEASGVRPARLSEMHTLWTTVAICGEWCGLAAYIRLYMPPVAVFERWQRSVTPHPGALTRGSPCRRRDVHRGCRRSVMWRAQNSAALWWSLWSGLVG